MERSTQDRAASRSSEMKSRRSERKRTSRSRSRERKHRRRSRSSSVSSYSSREKKSKNRKDRKHKKDRHRSRHESRSSDSESRNGRERKQKKEKKKKERKYRRSEERGGREELEPELMDQRRRQMEEKRSEHLVSLFGYSNTDNPYGDSKLSEQFVWKKKIETNKGSKRREFDDRVKELESVRKRRKDRQEEREATEKIREEEARMREREVYGDLEKMEEEQDRQQEKNRCRMRLRNHRSKLLDEMYKNLLLVEEVDDINEKMQPSLLIAKTNKLEKRTPYHLLEGYGFLSLEDLKAGIEVFIERQIDEDFWEPILVVVNDRIASERRAAEDPSYVHPSKESVSGLLKDKSVAELSSMRDEILNTRIGKGMGDDDYWKYVVSEISVALAKASIRNTHIKLLRKLGVKITVEEILLDEMQSRSATSSSAANQVEAPTVPKSESSEAGWRNGGFIAEEDLQLARLMAGLSTSQLSAIPIIDELEDQLERRKNRKIVLEGERKQNAALFYTYLHVGGGQSSMEDDIAEAERLAANKRAEAEAAQEENGEDGEMVEDEQHMTEADEVVLPSQTLSWHDKYKPRKPRYFNKVRTGFIWSKYNKAHYDSENPPPRTVFGYKFNIWYPDLIDKTKTPTYKIEKADSPDFAIIRFHAGPPYEDVAFKILNSEWRMGRKTGFRCLFEHDKLQLHFSLKRKIYKR